MDKNTLCIIPVCNVRDAAKHIIKYIVHLTTSWKLGCTLSVKKNFFSKPVKLLTFKNENCWENSKNFKAALTSDVFFADIFELFWKILSLRHKNYLGLSSKKCLVSRYQRP